jgi:hypothetical protein
MITKFQRWVEAQAWAVWPYETHQPSVDAQGKPCVVCYTGKVYMWHGYYIVIARNHEYKGD